MMSHVKYKEYPDYPKDTYELANSLKIPPILASILIARGHKTPEQALQFLYPQLHAIPSPMEMHGMKQAVDTITEAIHDNLPVVLYGDYDVDGTCSLALLYLFFQSAGVQAFCFQPNRLTDGYGLTEKNIKHLSKITRCPAILITVDCGITSTREVPLAQELGFQVIITDHHEPSESLPTAEAVLNPRKKECPFPFKHLAGVGVAFYLAAGIRTKLVETGFWTQETAPNLKQLLDLVALGTVADVMQLTDCNRTLVRAGLEVLSNVHQRRAGITALMALAGIAQGPVNAEDISYRLAPRLNAAGRLGQPEVALALLCEQSLSQAAVKAAELENLNKTRKKLEEDTLQDALLECERQFQQGASILVYYGKHHPGITGILASRVVDKFGVPGIIFTDDTIESGIIKGSGRSINGFNLLKAVGRRRDLLQQFGGHHAALGLAMPKENLIQFRKAMHNVPVTLTGQGTTGEKTHFTYPMHIEDLVSGNGLENFQYLEPFGPGNEEPVYMMQSVQAEKRQILQNAHLKFHLRTGNHLIHAIGFNLAEHNSLLEHPVNIYFKLRRNTYRGETRWQLLITALAKPSI